MNDPAGASAGSTGSRGTGTSGRYFIDTNIFIYATGASYPLKEPCVRVLKSIAGQVIDATTSTEVIQELMHRFFSINKKDEGIEVAGMVLDLLNPVLPVEARDTRLALELCRAYPGLCGRDAVHAAVAMNRGIAHIISSDGHFDLIKEIKRIDPREL